MGTIQKTLTPWTIVVVGLPGVGKSTLSKFLAERLNTTAVNSGELLRDHLLVSNISLDEETSTGAVFIDTFGETIAGNVIADGALDANASIVDGVRLFSTLNAFKIRSITPFVVFLTAEEKIRCDRFISRTNGEGIGDIRKIHSILNKKNAWNADLPRFESISKWRFDNSGSIQDLNFFADYMAESLRAD